MSSQWSEDYGSDSINLKMHLNMESNHILSQSSKWDQHRIHRHTQINYALKLSGRNRANTCELLTADALQHNHSPLVDIFCSHNEFSYVTSCKCLYKSQIRIFPNPQLNSTIQLNEEISATNSNDVTFSRLSHDCRDAIKSLKHSTHTHKH